ncbi:MAG TPA: GxxExxY protein [Bacteroidia bacterium]|nr:GxxExxY protein [Bacteroidia bacterium]
MAFQTLHPKFIYADLSFKIIGCAYTVHNSLGGGHLEKTYHNALFLEFTKKKMQFVSKQKVDISYGKSEVNNYFPDFIVENLVVVEIKRRGRIITKDFEQARRYLSSAGKQLSLLIHFGMERVTVKRVVNMLP